MSSDTAKGAEGEASSPRGPAPQPSLITPVDEGSNPVYAVELPIFEGPLDLLLHLVRRHELDILDIPIAFVTEKYLEYLEVMRALDIEIAGDYLVMAATLAYLKSRELVPQQDAEEEESDGEDEDGEDPREALIRRLIEYERFRAAGRELNEMPVAGRDVFTRGGSIDLPPLDPGMAPVTLFRLAEAYARVLQRAKISKSHEVVIERVTVRQRMEQLSLLLEERGDVEFDSLFLEREWSSVLELRQMLVVTLMSVLELVKLGIIGVQQPTDTATIRLLRRASYAAAMQALTGYDEDASFGEGAAPKPGEPTPAGGAPTAGAAPQPPPAAPASGSPVARDGDAALGEGRGDGLTDVGSVATRSRVDSAEGIEEREALAALDEEGVEDEPGWGVSAADDAPERHGLAERKGLAEREDELEDGPERRHGSPSEDDLEDRSVQRAFATGGSVESAGLEEREALAETEDELEDELEDGPEWSALEAVDPAERHGLPSAGDLEELRASAADDSVESAGLMEGEALAETEDELEDELEDGPDWGALEAVGPAERHWLPSAGDLEGGRASAADDSVESAGLVESEAPVESEDGVEDRSERHGPPFEGDAEDRADMRASTADDSVESEAFAHSENRVEDRSEMSAFAEGDAVEIDIEPEREAPAVREGDVEDGSDGSAFEADDAVESGGPPESEASADSGVHEDATGGLTAEDGPVADGSGLRETDPPLADAMSDDAGGPPEGLAERRGDPREAGWIPAAIDEGEQPSGEEWPPEEPPANEAVRAARVDSGAPTADNTRDGPSTVDGGEDPRESDE